MYAYIHMDLDICGHVMCLPAKKVSFLLCLGSLFENFQSHIVLRNYIGKELIEHAWWLNSAIYL